MSGLLYEKRKSCVSTMKLALSELGMLGGNDGSPLRNLTDKNARAYCGLAGCA